MSQNLVRLLITFTDLNKMNTVNNKSFNQVLINASNPFSTKDHKHHSHRLYLIRAKLLHFTNTINSFIMFNVSLISYHIFSILKNTDMQIMNYIHILILRL